MKETRVLIVYEEVPEKTTLFVLDMTEKEFQKYSKLAGQFINTTIMTKELEDVANELYSKLFYSEYPTKGEWANREITAEQALTVRIDAVLLTGMLM